VKRALLLVLIGVVLIAMRLRQARSVDKVNARVVAADSAFADSVLRAAEDMGAVVEMRSSGLAAPVRDANEIRLALQAYAAETYIGELFAARDSNNYRWPERTAEPLHVWIQTAPLGPDEWDWPRAVEEAFVPWTATGIPVAFLFTGDSARADVRVTWVDRYESRTSGRTRWVRDQHGWIISASIEIARSQPDGRALDARSVGAVARHEVGHLLGLDHTADESSIMAATVRVTELNEADRNTVRLVYRLPPGSVRAP
jgi:Matrixin